MKRISLLWPLGLVLVLVGGVWTAQGVGWLKGSAMTNETLWAVIGPIVMVVGIVLAVIGTRRRRD